MKKTRMKITALLCIFALAISATGCSSLVLPGQSEHYPLWRSTPGVFIGGETLDDGRVVDGLVEGLVGDTLSTAWFDMTVTEINYVDEFEGFTPEPGKKLVHAKILLSNTFGDVVHFYDTDFPLIYDLDEEQRDFSPFQEAFTDTMLGTVDLEADQEKTYDLLYQVPEDQKGPYAIWYSEYYDDEVDGNVFWMYWDI